MSVPPKIPEAVFNPEDYPRSYRTSSKHHKRHALISLAGIALLLPISYESGIRSWDAIINLEQKWVYVSMYSATLFPLLASIMAKVTFYADKITYRRFLFPVTMLRENIEGIRINYADPDEPLEEGSIIFHPVYENHDHLQLPMIFDKDAAFINWIYSLPVTSTSWKPTIT